MIEFNLQDYCPKTLKLFFWRIDFNAPGKYTREMFILYHYYKENYYYKMQNDWHMHNLSNYLGIITVWYFKPD